MTSINYTNKPLKTSKILGIAGALLTLAIPYFIMLQNSHIEADQSLCPFMMLTGLPCPGCGITKSLIFLYQGDIIKSFYYHLFGPFAFLFCLTAILTLSIELITQKEYFNQVIYNKNIAYTLGFVLAFYHFTRLVNYLINNNVHTILKNSIWM